MGSAGGDMSTSSAGSVSPTLTTAIATKLAQAHLPWEWPTTNRGSWGSGRPCTVCGDSIDQDAAEVEAGFDGGDRRVFHARCFIEWWNVVSGKTTLGRK